MTNRQKQWQLYLLGFLTEESQIDGIMGPVTTQATRDFQEAFGIRVDGVFGISTENKSREILNAIQDSVSQFAAQPLVKDGFAGPRTRAAVTAFQLAAGLPATGIVRADTMTKLADQMPKPEQINTIGDWWQQIRYFTREELKCKCGGRYCNGYPAEPQETAVRLADNARAYFGAPAHNVSFLRCRRHNANSGGVVNSRHMLGKAMDIRIDGVSGDRLLGYFLNQPGVRYAYKINETNVHFETD